MADLQQARTRDANGSNPFRGRPSSGQFIGEHDQDYFAEGMTDELTTMLAKDSTLRIVSRT
jgi:hypothetical protein